MKRYSELLFLFLSLSVIIGCVNTEINSFKDPDFVKDGLKKTLVCARGVSGIWEKKKVEEKLAGELLSRGLSARPCVTVFHPNFNYTEDEMQDIILENGFDSVFLLQLTDRERELIPCYGVEFNKCFNRGVQGSGTNSLAKLYFSINLYSLDASDSSVVWSATSKTSGNKYATYDALVHSLVNTVVSEMEEDGLLN